MRVHGRFRARCRWLILLREIRDLPAVGSSVQGEAALGCSWPDPFPLHGGATRRRYWEFCMGHGSAGKAGWLKKRKQGALGSGETKDMGHIAIRDFLKGRGPAFLIAPAPPRERT